MNRAATIALAPLSLIYGAAVKIRSALYRNRIFKTHEAAAPVISVGNITTGGTGKTPLVVWIAAKLAERHHRVCVLTRGYGRRNPHERVVVSNDSQVVSDVEHAGDEAFMMAEALKGRATVVCDADRVLAANWVLDNLGADVFVLDDGFQNFLIDRDLDIVTIDATNPWGNGWLLPAGILREPIGSLDRADCIILTRAVDVAGKGLDKRIKQITDAAIFSSNMVIQRIRSLETIENSTRDELVRNQPIAAFCGIGNPKAFFQQLGNEGFDLRHIEAFGDHHKYSQADIDRLTQRAVDTGAQALITTAKDAVKIRPLRFTLPCYVAEIEIEISEADRLLALIERAIHTKASQVNDQG